MTNCGGTHALAIGVAIAAIAADLPSEARLQPNLWATFVFER
jgi:hypothetical protein